jgi:hypothetical protein
MRAELIRTLEGAGRRAGEAQRKGDSATVAHWRETLTRLRSQARAIGLDAESIFGAAYREGYGAHRPQYFR